MQSRHDLPEKKGCSHGNFTILVLDCEKSHSVLFYLRNLFKTSSCGSLQYNTLGTKESYHKKRVLPFSQMVIYRNSIMKLSMTVNKSSDSIFFHEEMWARVNTLHCYITLVSMNEWSHHADVVYLLFNWGRSPPTHFQC